MPCLQFCVCEERATNLPQSLSYIMFGVMRRSSLFAPGPGTAHAET